MKRGWIVAGELHGSAFVRIGEGIEALRFLLALPIDDQVARDREEPGVKFRFAVVLVPALQHADPGLLKEVFGALAISRYVEQIPEQPVLLLLNETVEQLWVAASQPEGYGLFVVRHQCREQQGGRRGKGRRQ